MALKDPAGPQPLHPPFEHVVLLRGLAREAGHWGTFVKCLATTLHAHFPDRPLHCVDLPGAGRRCQQICPTRIVDIADSIAQEVARPGPALVLGMSMGGMVGLELIQRPELNVAGLVAINTSAGTLNPLYERLSPLGLGLVFASLAAPTLRLRESWIHRFTSNRPATRNDTVPRWIELAKCQPVARTNLLRQLWAASHFVPAPCRPSRPVLWLASTGDRMVSARCSQALHRHLGGELAIHGDAGHDLIHDDPQWCVGEIEKWICRRFARTNEIPPATEGLRAKGQV